MIKGEHKSLIIHYRVILTLGSDDNIKNIVVKPKTIKDIQSNTRLLQAFNSNHKDDIFMNSKARKRKIVKVIMCSLNGSWLKNITSI